MLNQVRVQASQSLVVPLLGKNIRLEPMQRGRERDARVSPFPRSQHPTRGVLSQSFRVVRVLVPGEPAVDRLAQQVSQRELGVASGAGIGEVSLDQRAQAKVLIQLARQQQPGIRRDRGTMELDAKLRIEREANRARFRVTHWIVPSAPARHPRNPHFLRALSDYGPSDSPLKTKIRVNKWQSLKSEFTPTEVGPSNLEQLLGTHTVS